MKLSDLSSMVVFALWLLASQLSHAQGIVVLSNTNEAFDGIADVIYGARIACVPGPNPGGYELTGISIEFGENSDVDYTNIIVNLYESNYPGNLDALVSSISVPTPETAGTYFYAWPTNLFLPRQVGDEPTNYYEFDVQPGTNLDPGNEAESDDLNVAETTSTNYAANAGWVLLPDFSVISGFTNSVGTHILFSIYATVLPPPVLYPIHLRHAAVLSDGSFQFDFTNSPGFSFTTYGTTNLVPPFTNWLYAGNPVNVASNYYLYNSGPGIVTSPAFPRIYFRVSSP